jgi:DNA replication protein DnaC
MHKHATLPLLLKQLNLSCMQSHWEEVALEAEQAHWSYPDYLAVLANREVANRQQKRIVRQIREACLPVGKTLDTFDFKAGQSVNAAQITTIANNNDWVKQGGNIVLFGPAGVGKTHLASAIGYRLLEKGIRVFFMPTTSMVQKLQQARRDYKLPDYLARLSRFDVLILDDIGYVKKDEAETSVIFELIAQRYENRSLMITSNQPFSEWGQIFPDNIMAVAAIDRLVHHATIINVTDESYRRRQSIKNQPKNP